MQQQQQWLLESPPLPGSARFTVYEDEGDANVTYVSNRGLQVTILNTQIHMIKQYKRGLSWTVVVTTVVVVTVVVVVVTVFKEKCKKNESSVSVQRLR